jgi:uncharacterized protein (DUF2252 family)
VTLEERRARGKTLRDRVPRAELGLSKSDTLREDLVFILQKAARDRRPELLSLRWKRMATSPLEFLRGAAAVMAADVGPRKAVGLDVQVCGDAHLFNLGAHAGDGGRLVFDVDDFDETCRGPFEWDLKRLAASLVVGGREAGHEDASCIRAVRAFVRAYRGTVESCARLPALEIARLEVSPDVAGILLAPIFGRAARDTPAQLMAKATVSGVAGLARFRRAPPMQTRLAVAQARALFAALPAYRETLGPASRQLLDKYQPRDLAFHAAGVGSLGIEEYLVLLYGDGPGDPLFLQLKEERTTCWLPYLAPGQEPRPPHQGRRAAEGQLRMQSVTDPLLGWTRIGDRDFLVRQWSDHKSRLEVGLLKKRGVLEDYAALCGRVLGLAHARSGDPAAISGYCGRSERLDSALAAFAVLYADQTEIDCERFRRGFAGRRAAASASARPGT